MSDSQVVIRKIEIPPTGVFQLEVPEGAQILKVVASEFGQYGCKFRDGHPVPFMWVLCDPLKGRTETRTFIRIQGRTQFSQVDAQKLRASELTFVGSVIIPRENKDSEEVTYFIFEDESERTK